METEPTESEPDHEVHALMACGLVPVLMLPLTWWLTLRRVFGRGAPGLVRRLLAIAIFDTMLAAALVGVLATKGPPTPPHASDPPRIGIQIDAASKTRGARVAAVWSKSPAERAGLARGDVITSIDGKPVLDWEALTAELRTRESGAVRSLGVRRGERELSLDVAPLSSLSEEQPPPPLFAPEPGAACGESWVSSIPSTTWTVPVGCFVIFVIALGGALRRRERRLPGWTLVLVPLVAAPALGVAAAYGACNSLGGWSIGTALLGLIAQGAAMLGLGWLVLRVLGAQLDAHMGPRLSTSHAARLAVLYIASAMARAAIALFVLMTLVPSLQQARDPGLGALLTSAGSPLGRVMMVTAAVVLAPVAEEVVFRGILLPGLAQHMKTHAALVVSAALFGLFHVPSHGVGAIMPALLGLVFGWARLRTGSLVTPMLLHGANNLFVLLLAWLM